jgi:CheY-like chemotaxis protein
MSLSKGQILVVDDRLDWRKTLSSLLLDQGYDVRQASTLHEALQAASNEQFDVAILDVRLDEADESNREGLSLMRQLNEIDPAIATIILTGYADVEMVQEALQPNSQGISPAFSFLQKTEIDQLPEYVERAVRLSRRNAEHALFRLLDQGEGQQLEFKSSFRWDFARGNVNKDLQEVVAVAVAGMLNSDGGTLLIGIADDGRVVGIDKDLKTLHKQNTDGFQLTLIDVLKKHLGVECLACIHVDFAHICGKLVSVVSIENSPKPVFFARGAAHEFWVRAGNSTHKLDVMEAMNYKEAHWGKVE